VPLQAIANQYQILEQWQQPNLAKSDPKNKSKRENCLIYFQTQMFGYWSLLFVIYMPELWMSVLSIKVNRLNLCTLIPAFVWHLGLDKREKLKGKK
jgi:hypothetical protein